MQSKRTVNLHPVKVWSFICVLYGAEIRHSILLPEPNYEGLADLISKDFHLTPEQWEAVLQEWEFTVSITSRYK